MENPLHWIKPVQIEVFDYIKSVREYSYLKQMDREWVLKKTA